MERLTHRYTDGRPWTSMNNVAACGEYECVGPAIDRLAAYEDAGIEPEWIKIMEGHAEDMETLLDFFGHLDCGKPFFARMEEIAKAEKEGRLLVLPCKVDTVYTIEEDLFNCDACENKEKAYYNSLIQRVCCDMDVRCPLYIEEHICSGFTISFDKDGNAVLSSPGEWGYEGLETFSGIDGKWHLHHEEAEAALVAQKGGEG